VFPVRNLIFKYYFDEFHASVNYCSALLIDRAKEGSALICYELRIR
jgi:hypothetical protein